MFGLFVTNHCGFLFPLCRANYGHVRSNRNFNRTGTRQFDFNLSLVSQILIKQWKLTEYPQQYYNSMDASAVDSSAQQKPSSATDVAREGIILLLFRVQL
jgi:hypothetical protein